MKIFAIFLQNVFSNCCCVVMLCFFKLLTSEIVWYFALYVLVAPPLLVPNGRHR